MIEPTPNKPATKAPLRDRILRAYCWTVLITILYIFSIGPLSWSYYASLNLGENRLVALYFAPVTIARQLFEPFDAWVAWYMDLWMFDLGFGTIPQLAEEICEVCGRNAACFL